MEKVVFSGEFRVAAETLFAWHERPGAFERLNPPWAPVRIVSQDAGVKDGARVRIKVPLGPIQLAWDLEHRGYIAGQEFSDVQLRGPFSAWKHRHLVESTGTQSSRLTDAIEYAAPLGPLGKIANAVMIERDLKRVFKYRHEVLKNDLALLSRYPASRPLRVLISGASGLVGTSLTAFLGIAGHEVWKLVRRPASTEKKEIFWDPERGILDEASLEGFDAVINLSGENVAGARWSAEFKQQLLTSRTHTTSLLVERFSKSKSPPKTFLCASAIGFYGSREEETLVETSPVGSGFLPEICVAWENAARQAEQFGARVVTLRIGIVLSPRGGALQKMLLPFLAGGGGVVGDGQQFMSWISLDDVVGGFYHALMSDTVRGAVNLVAPRAANNLQFTKTLGAVLKRPTIMPLPAVVVKTIFGEMGEALLLGSTRVVPSQLQATGYTFLYPELEAALRHQLGR